VALEGQRQNIFEQVQEKHQLMALEDQVTLLQNYKHYSFSDENLFRIGITQMNNQSKPQFIQRNFAECFLAQFLIKKLGNKTEENKQVLYFLLQKVFNSNRI